VFAASVEPFFDSIGAGLPIRAMQQSWAAEPARSRCCLARQLLENSGLASARPRSWPADWTTQLFFHSLARYFDAGV